MSEDAAALKWGVERRLEFIEFRLFGKAESIEPILLRCSACRFLRVKVFIIYFFFFFFVLGRRSQPIRHY